MTQPYMYKGKNIHIKNLGSEMIRLHKLKYLNIYFKSLGTKTAQHYKFKILIMYFTKQSPSR
jgi:hypothetical protein